MYPPPNGQSLTAHQAQLLDDSYLASDPFQYFQSRIASLLTWSETAPIATRPSPAAEPESVRAEFNNYLQRPALDGPLDELQVEAQVAADALSLRHHAAEALLRFACARLSPSRQTPPICLWEELATGPQHITDVIQRLISSATHSDAGDRMFRALVPPTLAGEARGNDEVIGACNVFVEWFNYALQLLSTSEIDIHSGHNKIKHGLAVRARSDFLLTLTATPPNPDGNVALSALTGSSALDIFDQPVLEFLSKGPKVDGHRQGLEVTLLRLKPSALLADAYMLAMTHAALFHVAATEHFASRSDIEDGQCAPPFPGFPVGGPLPTNIDSHSAVGMRFPLTTPPGGSSPRPAILGFRTFYHILNFDYSNRTRGRVVDDEEPPR